MPKHNSYFDGEVQSLSSTFRGQDYSVGVLEPGEHKFVPDRFEKVRVLFGVLVDKRDDSLYSGFPVERLAMDLPEFRPGETVRLECEQPVAYLCLYSDKSFDVPG